jgi:hypothetical protein
MLVPLARMMWVSEDEFDVFGPDNGAVSVQRPAATLPVVSEFESFTQELVVSSRILKFFRTEKGLSVTVRKPFLSVLELDSAVKHRLNETIMFSALIPQQWIGGLGVFSTIEKPLIAVFGASSNSFVPLKKALGVAGDLQLLEKVDLLESLPQTINPKKLTIDLDPLYHIAKKNRAPFTELENIIKKRVSQYFKVYQRRPTTAQLRRLALDLRDNLKAELKRKVDEWFRKNYLATQGNVAQELGLRLIFNPFDEQALNVLQNQKVLYEAYEGLTNPLIVAVNNAIITAYQNPRGLTIPSLTKDLQRAANIADYKAELIARTETSKVQAAARRNSYLQADPEDRGLYRWIGPEDHRTTATSRRIKARVGLGVSWRELINVIKEESKKEFPKWIVNDDFPVSHYNSRHTFIRVN